MRRLLSALACVAAILQPHVTSAQAARTAQLVLTVVDQTGAVIPGATVTAVRVDDPEKAVIGPVKTTEKGVATLEKLVPGIYTIEAEFAGFEKRMLKDIRIRRAIGAYTTEETSFDRFRLNTKIDPRKFATK